MRIGMRGAVAALVAALTVMAGACTTDNDGHARPSYGYSAPYGYPYGGAGAGPSITFAIPQG